jgi:[histone H3]-lysine36 N-dimethyltransferase SETMAR
MVSWHQYYGVRAWDARDIICIMEYYMALLEHLNDEIKKKTAQFEEKKVLYRQDNALCHKSIKTTAKLHELCYELLPHPPYSPDLAPIDLFLFADLKRMLAGKKSRG